MSESPKGNARIRKDPDMDWDFQKDGYLSRGGQ